MKVLYEFVSNNNFTSFFRLVNFLLIKEYLFSPSLSYTHSSPFHTQTRTHIHTHSLSLTLTPSLSHTHTPSLSLSHTLSHPNIHTHSLTLSLSLPLSLTHTDRIPFLAFNIGSDPGVSDFQTVANYAGVHILSNSNQISKYDLALKPSNKGKNRPNLLCYIGNYSCLYCCSQSYSYSNFCF